MSSTRNDENDNGHDLEQHSDDNVSLVSGDQAMYRSIDFDTTKFYHFPDNASLVSGDQAVYRSIDYRSIDFDTIKCDHSRDDVGLHDPFVKETSQPLPSSKTAPLNVVVFTAPPSLPEDMHCVIARSTLFCSAPDVQKVRAHVLSALEKCDCFVAGSSLTMDTAKYEESEWLVCLIHYSRKKFSIDLNVMFWTLDQKNMESTRKSFPNCPEDAKYAIEFQRIGGDSFAWMDLWHDIWDKVGTTDKSITYTLSSKKLEPRCILDNDLLLSDDSEDDDMADAAYDPIRLLDQLLRMSACSGYSGQLEVLQTLCRMCDNKAQSRQMLQHAAFREYVVKVFDDLQASCVECRGLLPLLRCATSLLAVLVEYLVETTGQVDVVKMESVRALMENECPALRCEAAALLLSLVRIRSTYPVRAAVLEVVAAGLSRPSGHCAKVTALLNTVQREASI